jgi:hypothetical protein
VKGWPWSLLYPVRHTYAFSNCASCSPSGTVILPGIVSWEPVFHFLEVDECLVAWKRCPHSTQVSLLRHIRRDTLIERLKSH